MTDPRIVVWRRLDHPGHDYAQLVEPPDGALVGGTVVMSYDGQPTVINYDVVLDAKWHTREVRVAGTIAGDAFEIALSADGSGRWALDGRPLPDVAGCIDVDLAFTPATNLLPIRRLSLAIGESAHVRAAWVRFPELSVEVLEQTYRRTGANEYAYESDGGAFHADLMVNEAGLVIRYPGLWEAE